LGAANMTIPRRDLLTGSALLLVGSRAACAKPAKAKQKLLRTKFMADFTAAFIGDPKTMKGSTGPGEVDAWPDTTRIWPTTGQKAVDIVADYATFVNVLMTVGYVLAPPPAAASGSLGDRIAKFLQAQNWPTKTTFPPEYKDELPTVHQVEIAVILDRLQQAMNSFGAGAGGGGSNWPPH